MALVVEDGTGLASADALISLAYWKTYADAFGWDHSSYSDSQLEQGIRRASAWISDAFEFEGYRTKREQALAFPRYGLVDGSGYVIESDEVPAEVERATAEAAWREIQTPNSLSPDVTAAEVVTREKVGPLEVEYAESSQLVGASTPFVSRIQDILRHLIAGNRGGAGVELLRA